jgi:acetolactate synthase-1/2/3 large subunit
MVEKVTKYSTRVSKPIDVLYELEKSYHLTKSGRLGPVWIEIPMDVQSAPIKQSSLRSFTPEPPIGKSNEIKAELELSVIEIKEQLLQAKRPVIWLGHGIRLAGAQAMVGPMLEQKNIPALVSWQAIDIVDSEHPLVFGRAGVYGQRFSNFVLQNCDFLLCIGTRMAIPQIGYDLSEFVREAKIACVDIDPLEVEKLEGKIDFPVCADAKDFIDLFVGDGKNENIGNYSQWVSQCNTYREKYPVIGPEHQDKNGFINSYRFMERLSRDMKSDQHVVTDMGTALLSGHQVLSLKPGQRLMTSTGLGEMGFALPAAIGVSFGRDHGEVLCLNCDGGMMMNLQELQTIAHHKLPIKIIVFNNDGYLMIKNTQTNLFKGRYSGTSKSTGVSCPDFQKIAQAFDFEDFQIRTWDDYNSQIKDFLNCAGPAICEVFMDPEQLSNPKLGLSIQEDGSLISPPLEDLSPFISRDEMRENMLIGIHPKSESIKVD